MRQTRHLPAQPAGRPPTPMPTAAAGWRRHLPTPLQLLGALFFLAYAALYGLSYANLVEKYGPRRAVQIMEWSNSSPF
jgi:hypothetical protein